jgi:hypothetical protein
MISGKPFVNYLSYDITGRYILVGKKNGYDILDPNKKDVRELKDPCKDFLWSSGCLFVF